jgi:hypothetical protein
MLGTVELVAFNNQQHKKIIFIVKSLCYRMHAVLSSTAKPTKDIQIFYESHFVLLPNIHSSHSYK